MIINNCLTFIDLFAGIGGFHLGLKKAGMKCVLACEIDEYARKTYEYNHKVHSPEIFTSGNFIKDIRNINPKLILDFDILCAGFPCQPFSQVGQKKGFKDKEDDRGNMFFEIIRIIQEKRPKVLFLENVRNLVNHDDGRTFKIIKDNVEKNGYSFNWKVIKASDHGLPQHRPRIYMVCFRNDLNIVNFEFPSPRKLELTMSDIFGGNCNKEIGYTIRVGGKSSGLNDRRNWDTYLVNGKIKKITKEHGKMMLGFPEEFFFPVSETQAMKQLGNSVAVNSIYDISLKIKNTLENKNKKCNHSNTIDNTFIYDIRL